MKAKQLLTIFSIASLLVLVPLIAMQFTDEVNWDLADFSIAAFLIFSTALGMDFILRKVSSFTLKMGMTIALFALFILIWAQFAVDFF